MKAGIMYSLSRTLFGLFIMWYAVNVLYPAHMIEYNQHITRTFVEFNATAQFFYETFPSVYMEHAKVFWDKYIDINILKESAEKIAQIIPILLLLGGFFCICGYTISAHFVLLGLFFDLILVHNFYYYRDEKMRVDVLKMVSVFAGAYFII